MEERDSTERVSNYTKTHPFSLTIASRLFRLCITLSCYWCVCVLGFYMEPTIFTEVEDHMFVAKEESFGPVMIISVFEDG